jgi:endo-1,4-beta-xylanase
VIHIDKIAPTLSISVDNAVLKTANHKLIPIQVTVNGSDFDGSGVKLIVLTSITSNEDENGLGDGNTTDDVQDAQYDTSDTSFFLRAERSGKGTDRVYTITYTITDYAGNTNTASATVTVAKGGK